MALVLVSSDLATISRVEGAAQLAGETFQSVASSEAAAACCAELPARLVLVDLTTPNLDVATLVDELKKLAAGPLTIIAFGPHVHDALLAAAAEAGCDQVLSRGQFFAQLGTIVRGQVI